MLAYHNWIQRRIHSHPISDLDGLTSNWEDEEHFNKMLNNDPRVYYEVPNLWCRQQLLQKLRGRKDRCFEITVGSGGEGKV